MRFENLISESAFRRAIFCEILSHSVRNGMYDRVGGIKGLAQGHHTMHAVGLETTTPQSQVKLNTTEPLRSSETF